MTIMYQYIFIYSFSNIIIIIVVIKLSDKFTVETYGA